MRNMCSFIEMRTYSHIPLPDTDFSRNLFSCFLLLLLLFNFYFFVFFVFNCGKQQAPNINKMHHLSCCFYTTNDQINLSYSASSLIINIWVYFSKWLTQRVQRFVILGLSFVFIQHLHLSLQLYFSLKRLWSRYLVGNTTVILF